MPVSLTRALVGLGDQVSGDDRTRPGPDPAVLSEPPESPDLTREYTRAPAVSRRHVRLPETWGVDEFEGWMSCLSGVGSPLVIVIVAALKGGVGKTSTAVYLSAAGAGRRAVTLMDADPQASAAEWLEAAEDPALADVELAEVPTERLLTRALAKVGPDELAVVDTPPGHERLLEAALDAADVAVIPTRVGGVETTQAEAVLRLIPRRVPAGLVISSARTHTRDYQDAVATWQASSVPVWGSIPERVSIAAGPTGRLSTEGLEAYRSVWRRVQRAARPG